MYQGDQEASTLRMYCVKKPSRMLYNAFIQRVFQYNNASLPHTAEMSLNSLRGLFWTLIRVHIMHFACGGLQRGGCLL